MLLLFLMFLAAEILCQITLGVLQHEFTYSNSLKMLFVFFELLSIPLGIKRAIINFCLHPFILG